MDRPLTVDHLVGTNLRRIRETRGITGLDIAARMTAVGSRWTTSTVNLVETGKRKVTLSEVADLLMVLGVPLPELLSLDAGGAYITAETRARALCGDQAPAPAATGVDPESLRRERQARRVLARIAAAVDWARVPEHEHAGTDVRIDAVLDALHAVYGSDDILDVRERMARAQAADDELAVGITIDDISGYLPGATRVIARTVAEELEATQDGADPWQ